MSVLFTACFFCQQVSKSNDVITKPSHPGCWVFTQSAFDSLIIALSCTVTLAVAFFVCLQDDGAWSADAGPELDFSGGWPGHCCGELLRFYAPHLLAYPYTNLYKLACDQFLSRPAVVINWFNYTHTALEKCVCECSEGGEMIIHSHTCAYTVPTYRMCVWKYPKHLQCEAHAHFYQKYDAAVICIKPSHLHSC